MIKFLGVPEGLSLNLKKSTPLIATKFKPNNIRDQVQDIDKVEAGYSVTDVEM